MSRRPPLPLRGWLAAHGARPGLLVALVLSPAVAALLARGPLPRVAPPDVVVDPRLDPAHLGLVGLALSTGIVAMLVADRLAWATDVSSRAVPMFRLAWAVTVLAAQGVGAVLGTALLPAHLGAGAAWLSPVPLLWGLCLLGAALLGPLAGTLLPVAAVAAQTFGVLPWHADVLFNPDLLAARLGLGAALAAAGLLAYAGRGTRRQRGVLPAAD